MNTKLFFASLFLGTIFSTTAQTIISFETSEGYIPGILQNQKGWTVFDTSTTTPSPHALIVNDKASVGDNSLKFFADNTAETITISKGFVNVIGSQVTLSLDLFIDTSIDIVVRESSLLTSRCAFSSLGNITAQSIDNDGNLFNETIGTYNKGKWMNLKLNYDFSAHTIKYYLDGVFVYSGKTLFGTRISSLSFTSTNAGIRSFNIDNIQVGATVLGVKENELASRFSIYPNPATDVVNVSNKNAKITGVTLTDLNGRTVKQLSYDNLSHVTVNTTDLSAGMYLMNIRSSEGNATKKIVKN